MLTNYASPTRFSNAKKKINNKSVYFPSEQRRKYHCHDGADLITITPHYIHIVLMRTQRGQLVCWNIFVFNINNKRFAETWFWYRFGLFHLNPYFFQDIFYRLLILYALIFPRKESRLKTISRNTKNIELK